MNVLLKPFIAVYHGVQAIGRLPKKLLHKTEDIKEKAENKKAKKESKKEEKSKAKAEKVDNKQEKVLKSSYCGSTLFFCKKGVHK